MLEGINKCSKIYTIHKIIFNNYMGEFLIGAPLILEPFGLLHKLVNRVSNRQCRVCSFCDCVL